MSVYTRKDYVGQWKSTLTQLTNKNPSAKISGFLRNSLLLDINECTTNVHNCDPNAFCNNTDGSYNCTYSPRVLKILTCNLQIRLSGQHHTFMNASPINRLSALECSLETQNVPWPPVTWLWMRIPTGNGRYIHLKKERYICIYIYIYIYMCQPALHAAKTTRGPGAACALHAR